MKLSAFPATVKTGPLSAVCLALEEWLVALFGRPAGRPDDKLVGIHATGRPPTIKGQWYFAIHPFGLGGLTKQADHIEQTVGVAITLSVKTVMVPTDRIGDAVLCGDRQALDVANYLADENAIHGSYAIMERATELLGRSAETRQGFVEPLALVGQTMAEQGPDWWRLSGSDSREFGYSIETRFDGMKLIRGRTE